MIPEIGISEYTVSIVPDADPFWDWYRLRVVRDPQAPQMWTVRRHSSSGGHGYVLRRQPHRDGAWDMDYDFNGGMDWSKRWGTYNPETRYDLDGAIGAARAAAPHTTVGGVTAAEYMAGVKPWRGKRG